MRECGRWKNEGIKKENNNPERSPLILDILMIIILPGTRGN
jgi:hypothetical protein